MKRGPGYHLRAMASATVRLFVYGSLKRGGLHHDELEALGALFVGEAETLPGYRLEALGEYLALVAVSPGAPGVVQGELFEVPEAQLPALDAFEGDTYTRGVVKVRLQPLGAAKPRHQEESLAYFKKAR
jgi:gamma-glutamylcyclotransferase (GGCT)/AIG2-like uncharacterized protein YtfP